MGTMKIYGILFKFQVFLSEDLQNDPLNSQSVNLWLNYTNNPGINWKYSVMYILYTPNCNNVVIDKSKSPIGIN